MWFKSEQNIMLIPKELFLLLNTSINDFQYNNQQQVTSLIMAWNKLSRKRLKNFKHYLRKKTPSLLRIQWCNRNTSICYLLCNIPWEKYLIENEIIKSTCFHLCCFCWIYLELCVSTVLGESLNSCINSLHYINKDKLIQNMWG